MKSLISFILILTSATSFAEVTSSSANGFSVQIEKSIPTNSQKLYQQFLNIGQWWDKDHTWFGKSENMFLQPKAGGCFCEIDGDNQVWHMTVTFVKPNEEVRMTGGLGPLQMMGLHGGMSWKFSSIDEQNSKLTLTYNVSGYSKDGLESLAPIVNQVLQLQVDKLAAKFNKTESSH